MSKTRPTEKKLKDTFPEVTFVQGRQGKKGLTHDLENVHLVWQNTASSIGFLMEFFEGEPWAETSIEEMQKTKKRVQKKMISLAKSMPKEDWPHDFCILGEQWGLDKDVH